MSVGGENAIQIFDESYKGNYDYVVDKIENDKSKNWLTLQDSNGRITLHWAALNGNADLTKYLLEAGSSVDHTDDIGMTPLVLAASAGRLDACRLLLGKSAQINHKNDEGHSALQYAASKGWTEIVKLLLINGADINIGDKRGATALHRAASKGMTATVSLLLSFKGIKLDVKDAYGNTPLHLSCEENRLEESSMLVLAGADVSVLNKEKKTPLDLGPPSLAKELERLAHKN